MDRSGSRNKLTQNLDRVGNVRTSNSKIDKTPDKMSIASRVRKRITIRSTKREIELHGSLNSTLISKSVTSKKIPNVPFLGNKESIHSGGKLNPKKIMKGPRSDMRNCSLRRALTKAIYSGSSPVM